MKTFGHFSWYQDRRSTTQIFPTAIWRKLLAR